MTACACGCGREISELGSRGRPQRFARGHRDRNVSYKIRFGATGRSTGYYRCHKVVPVMERCELEHIGGCHGVLQRAHLDGNPLNNRASNIKVLCISHHFLYDRGRIDLANPAMPDYWVSGGKRRYRPRLKPRMCRNQDCGLTFTSLNGGQRYCGACGYTWTSPRDSTGWGGREAEPGEAPPPVRHDADVDLGGTRPPPQTVKKGA